MASIIPDDVIQYLLESAHGAPQVTPGGTSDVDMHQEIMNRRAASRPLPSAPASHAGHAGHGGAATGVNPASPHASAARLPPQAVSPEDLDSFDAATRADRDASDKAALAQNLSRAGAIYRGVRDPGPVASPVPTNMRDWMARRGLVAEGEAAKANGAARDQANAPAPSEWNAPIGLSRSEALTQGYAKSPTKKPGDQAAPKEWGAPDGMTADQAIRAGYGHAAKPTDPAHSPPSDADRAELKRRGLNPDLASTHQDALHLLDIHQRSQDAHARADQTRGEKDDQYTEKLRDKYQKDMDAASASSRSAFGSSANIVFRGARILPLLTQKNPDGSPRQLTTQEWQDVSAALVAMQTNGVPPERMALNAMPRDAAGSAATAMSWLTAKPYAPDRQEWVQRFVDNISREEKASADFQHQTRLERHGRHTELMKRDPEWVRARASEYGLDQAGAGGRVNPDTLQVEKGEAQDAAGGAPRAVKSKAERDALPSGSRYTRPGDSTVYTKG